MSEVLVMSMPPTPAAAVVALGGDESSLVLARRVRDAVTKVVRSLEEVPSEWS